MFSDSLLFFYNSRAFVDSYTTRVFVDSYTARVFVDLYTTRVFDEYSFIIRVFVEIPHTHRHTH